MTIRDTMIASGTAIESSVPATEVTQSPGNATNLYLSKKNQVHATELPAVYFCVRAAQAGTIDIVWVQGNTVVKEQEEDVVEGLNVFSIDNTGFAGTATLGVRQRTGSILQVSTTGGDSVILSGGDGGTEVRSAFRMGFWAGYSPIASSSLSSTGLQLKVSNDQVVNLANDYTLDAGVVLDTVKHLNGNGYTLNLNGLHGLQIIKRNRLNVQDLTLSSNHSIDITTGPSTDANIEALSGMGSEKAIWFDGHCVDNLFSNLIIDGIDGIGVDIAGDIVDSGDGVVRLSNTVVKNCFVGIRLDERSEYNSVAGCKCHNNTYGLIWQGGNNSLTDLHLSSNRIGLAILTGNNDSHSSASGVTVNHNNLYGIYCGAIDNGVNIVSSQIHSGTSRLVGCKGFTLAYSNIQQTFETEDCPSVLFAGNGVVNGSFTITETGSGSTVLKEHNYDIEDGTAA